LFKEECRVYSVVAIVDVGQIVGAKFGGNEIKQYLCNEKSIKVMARPIKETPILYGEEARRFEMRMMNPEPVSKERRDDIARDYEFLRSRCVNCSF